MWEHWVMHSYRQYCPIARASQVLAERWTPIVLRNLLSGAETFTELARGAPGMSRSLLTSRLRELERVGVVVIDPHPSGRGQRYRPSEAGLALRPVLVAMGTWAEEWFELNPEDSDPGFLLHNWCNRYLAVDQLPERRVVIRFDFTDQPPGKRRLWMLVDEDAAEVCLTDPKMDEDLVVTRRVDSARAVAHRAARMVTGVACEADPCHRSPGPGPRVAHLEQAQRVGCMIATAVWDGPGCRLACWWHGESHGCHFTARTGRGIPRPRPRGTICSRGGSGASPSAPTSRQRSAPDHQTDRRHRSMVAWISWGPDQTVPHDRRAVAGPQVCAETRRKDPPGRPRRARGCS